MKLKIQSGEFVIEKIDKNATINLSDDLFCVVNEFDCYTIIKNKLKSSCNTQIIQSILYRWNFWFFAKWHSVWDIKTAQRRMYKRISCISLRKRLYFC